MNLTTGAEPDTSTGEVDEVGDEASDQCSLAPTIGAGVHRGSLRGYSSELEGACGRGGPDAFFRLEVPRRSDIKLRGLGTGFVPRVGVLPHSCASDWESRSLYCDEGVGTWLLDVAAGSGLVVSIGIDPENPELGLPPPMQGPDPLSFALEVRLRNVLEPGDLCEPSSRGRCTSGSACLAAPDVDEPDAPLGPARCTVLPGDTCESAVELALRTGVTTVELDPETLQTDAHAHSCGGARRRERVLRLVLPGPGPHALEVRGDRPQVGLALRSPSCVLEDERACADGEEAGTPVITAEVEGASALLFIELPPDETEDEGDTDGTSTGGTTGGEPGEEAPIIVEIEVLMAPASP